MGAQDEQNRTDGESAATKHTEVTAAAPVTWELLRTGKSKKLAELEQQVLTGIKTTFRELELLRTRVEAGSVNVSAVKDEFGKDAFQLGFLESVEMSPCLEGTLLRFFTMMYATVWLEGIDAFVQK